MSPWRREGGGGGGPGQPHVWSPSWPSPELPASELALRWAHRAVFPRGAPRGLCRTACGLEGWGGHRELLLVPNAAL